MYPDAPDGGHATLCRPLRYDAPAFSRRIAPEVCWLTPSSNQRAQGMPDARCTRGLMRSVHKECAHEHTGQRRTSDIPCAMALRLIACSPRRTAVLPPLRPERLLPPGALTPAPRRQDHTSLPYASAPFVKAHQRPPLPARRFVTIASAPLGGTGWMEL